MNDAKHSLAGQLMVFALLVAIGVAGRWGEPAWCVTPMAAIGLLAGYWFRRPGVAVLVPMTAMAVSDLGLASYDHALVQAAVYASLGASALVGRLLRQRTSSTPLAATRLGVGVLAPSLVFFLTTNFAVWAASGRYAMTAGGLADCYAAAVPFYRQMMVGDVVYASLLFAAAAAAGVYSIYGREHAAGDSSAVAA